MRKPYALRAANTVNKSQRISEKAQPISADSRKAQGTLFFQLAPSLRDRLHKYAHQASELSEIGYR